MASKFGQLARSMGRLIPPALLRHAGQPAALFFHGVERDTLDGRVQTNHHELAVFEAIVAVLRQQFDVRPLTDIDAVLAAPQDHPRAVFLMSDDGYANTLSTAAPVLDGLPWTLFVSTAHIGTGRPNPIFLARLFYFYAPNGVYKLPHLPGTVVLADAESRQAAAQAGIDPLRLLPGEKAEEALAAMTASFPPDQLAALVARFTSEHFLDWDGVRALKTRGVEIGAHGDSHWPMHALQRPDWLTRQAAGARARIEAEVGPCRFFAYPFGNIPDIGPGAWRAVREAGFTHAFTTLSGSLAPSLTEGPAANPWLLPRYGIGPADTHLASLVPLLSAGNRRVRQFRTRLAG
ncbi:MAG: polysaccharide deacetylase family protein [Alphaproteobacteria bacterium]|nr:polysaccharide deacetylase family protein [Alphaproteobacteria bacterium]